MKRENTSRNSGSKNQRGARPERPSFKTEAPKGKGRTNPNANANANSKDARPQKFVKPIIVKEKTVEAAEAEMREDLIIGRNPVMEAIKSKGRAIYKLFVSEGNNEGSIKKIIAEAKELGIVVQIVDKVKINQMAAGENHQGVIAQVSPYEYREVEELLFELRKKNERIFFVLCDEINDPHNLGSIIRTAEAAGANGVVIPKRRSVGVTATVVKTSAGAVEHMPVCKITNMANTIDFLKENNVWVAAADMDGESYYFDAKLDGDIAIVVGGEGSGVGRLVKSKCDYVLKIPMNGKVNSLNASVAASLLMYEVVRQSVKKTL